MKGFAGLGSAGLGSSIGHPLGCPGCGGCCGGKLGAVDPALVAQLVEAGVTVSTSAIQAAQAAQARKASQKGKGKQKAQAEAYTPPPMPAPAPAASGGVPWVPVLVTALVVGGGILLVRSQQQTRYPSSYRRVSRE